MQNEDKVISLWNKRASKWVKNGTSWGRTSVRLPYNQKMAMVITVVNGKKVTRHKIVNV